MSLRYCVDEPVSPEQFVDLLERSTLAARRPVDDRECINGMLVHADLLVTAWDGPALVGIARSVTDFHYACYLSDLAVAETHQRQGIGRRLVDETRRALGLRCKIILLAAPAARDYYAPLGFDKHPSCWVDE